MPKKILFTFFVFFSAKAAERIPGYGFTYDEWHTKKNPYDHIQEREEPVEEAQRLLANKWPVPQDMLFKSVAHRSPELILFFVGVARVNPHYIRNDFNALSSLLYQLAGSDSIPEAVVKNLLYVGVPLKYFNSLGKEFDIESSLQTDLSANSAKEREKAKTTLFCIEKTKKELAIAKAAHNKQLREAIVIPALLGTTSLADLIASYAEEEHVIPEAAQKKIDQLELDQKSLQKKVERDAEMSDCESLFCCCR